MVEKDILKPLVKIYNVIDICFKDNPRDLILDSQQTWFLVLSRTKLVLVYIDIVNMIKIS